MRQQRVPLRAAVVFVLLISPLAMRSPIEAQTVYVAFGDSITAGIGDDPNRPPRDTGYPPRLEALLQSNGLNASVINEGAPSEDTAEGLTRINGVLRRGGNVLLLMEGTNDLGPGISAETTRFNLEEMARRAEARSFSVIHTTVIPRLPNANRDPENLDTQVINELIRDLAGVEDRDLADPFEIFGSTDDLYDDYYDDDPNDRVGHPNARGYDLMAELFADVILGEDNVPPVTGLLTPLNGQTGVARNVTVEVDIWDLGSGIDQSNTELLIDGSVVEASTDPGASGKKLTFTYSPSTAFTGRVDVGLRSQDNAIPPNSVDRTISSFTVSGALFLEGDLDRDGRVDGVDLISFARAFGSRRGQARYVRDSDFNDDRIIDGEDLAVLAANFGDSTF
ncbi:MAG: hypothetical protein K0U98_25535 [Deltaproteobacteria bacterium]|nr:hypothetical protein [Deltaproteobacteria bacterium]